ncbi:MAG: hypothetical protein GVY29_01525, partial [Spirochaetes bacterium]|nr:hypothetical protein [Spirochaetota bacterium]
MAMADSSSGAKALLSTDVVDFSRLLDTHEMRALEELDHYTGLLKRLAREYHGEILSNTGDTFLVSFHGAADAVACAEKLQAGMRNRSGAADALPLMLRVAVHKGELAEREGNYYGETMATVLELRGITRPGGISVTEAVAQEVGLDSRWIRGSEQSGGMAWYTLAPEQTEQAGGDTAARSRPESESSTERRRGSTGASTGLPESSEVKTRLLQEMKRRGRRLTLGEAYDALDVRTPQERRALYNLAAAGFLARGRSGGAQGAARRGDEWDYRGGNARARTPVAGKRRPEEADEAILPSRRGFGDEREDREIESAWDQVLSRRFA